MIGNWISENPIVVLGLVIFPLGFIVDFSMRYREKEKQRLKQVFLDLHEWCESLDFSRIKATKRFFTRFLGILGLLWLIGKGLQTVGVSGTWLPNALDWLAGVITGLAVLTIVFFTYFVVLLKFFTWLISGILRTLGMEEKTVFFYISASIGSLISSTALIVELLKSAP